ncbi:MAG: regulator [Methylomonas sp.]|jgi:quercetin dioxygenase-like cupin family protein
MSAQLFDTRTVRWRTLEIIPYLHYRILAIDPENRIIDVLFKFAAGRQIVLHRHKVLNHTFVIAGEHWLYKADGAVKEIRATGSYIISPASDEPHREGGGADADAIVLFSIRGNGALYEILDDDLNAIGELSMRDFIDLYNAQP